MDQFSPERPRSAGDSRDSFELSACHRLAVGETRSATEWFDALRREIIQSESFVDFDCESTVLKHFQLVPRGFDAIRAEPPFGARSEVPPYSRSAQIDHTFPGVVLQDELDVAAARASRNDPDTEFLSLALPPELLIGREEIAGLYRVFDSEIEGGVPGVLLHDFGREGAFSLAEICSSCSESLSGQILLQPFEEKLSRIIQLGEEIFEHSASEMTLMISNGVTVTTEAPFHPPHYNRLLYVFSGEPTQFSNVGTRAFTHLAMISAAFDLNRRLSEPKELY